MSAQNIAVPASPSVRNLDRLTLLPGPYLLSPARGSDVAAPAPKPVDPATPGQALRFVPASEAKSPAAAWSFRPGVPAPGGTPAPTATPRNVDPNTLRFESTLGPVIPARLPSSPSSR